MKYANDIKAAYVVMIGGNEMEKGVLTVKDMHTGEQKELGLEELLALL